MMKNIAIAAALTVATVGLATSASAGYGHRNHGYHHGYSHYKPVYVYRHYQPVYHYYRSSCTYGWVWHHGHKVWGCVW